MPTFATLVTAVAMAGAHIRFWACIACAEFTPHKLRYPDHAGCSTCTESHADRRCQWKYLTAARTNSQRLSGLVETIDTAIFRTLQGRSGAHSQQAARRSSRRAHLHHGQAEYKRDQSGYHPAAVCARQLRSNERW